MSTFISSDLKLPGQIKKYQGKVRDVYYLENNIIVVVATDRISAFDTIMPKGVPYKGQVLNQLSSQMLKYSKKIIPNWYIDSPDPNVTVGRKCTPIKVEMVIRGYLSGHSFRQYKKGIRNLCGSIMPNGMKENDKFPNPIITPSTKADIGFHDEDISPDELIQRQIISQKDYKVIENYSLKLFQLGSKRASKQGLVLVDTKYEFGKDSDGNILLIDEVHTPDSSRFFYSNEYNFRQKMNLPQKQLSKEFFRQWLIKNNFSGKKHQKLPNLSTKFLDLVSKRYIELYEKLWGEKFTKVKSDNIGKRIQKNLSSFFNSNNFQK